MERQVIGEFHGKFDTKTVSRSQAKNTGTVLDPQNSGCYQYGMKHLPTGVVRPLTKLIRDAGLTQEALARLVDTSQPQINRLANEKRGLSREWAIKLAPHLKVSANDLMFGGLTVPVVGNVGAGSETHFYGQADANLGFARFPPGGSERTVAVEVRGDSLGGAFSGWLIYYDERRDPPTDDLLGALCVVGLSSGQVLVKTLMRGRLLGHWDLFAGVSGAPLTDQVVEWAARVTAILPPFNKIEIEAIDTAAEIPRQKPNKAQVKRRKK